MRFLLIGAVFAGAAPAQIRSLSTTADGRGVYFSTSDGSIRQRASNEPFSRKLYLLRGKTLTVIEDSHSLHTSVPTAYEPPAVNADGSILAVNRSLICEVGAVCR